MDRFASGGHRLGSDARILCPSGRESEDRAEKWHEAALRVVNLVAFTLVSLGRFVFFFFFLLLFLRVLRFARLS